MSNWDRRPLRVSQQHYAALDAYVLIEIVKRMFSMESGKAYQTKILITNVDEENKIIPINQRIRNLVLSMIKEEKEKLYQKVLKKAKAAKIKKTSGKTNETNQKQ